MSETDNLVYIKDVINRTYLKSKCSILPDSIDARFLAEILTIYMEYDSKICRVVTEEYNSYEAKLSEILTERNNKVNCIFKTWVNTEIIDIYTAFKVRKMPEDSITYVPFVSLLRSLRYSLFSFSANCVDKSLRDHIGDFHQIYKIIGYETHSFIDYVDTVIYEKFNR